MATKSAPTPASQPPAADHYDDRSGVYGFFRRHQKKLLYTAGLFVLLTFSITGPMMQLAQELFGATRPLPTLLVNGKRVAMQPEDAMYGQLLSNSRFAIPEGVLPALNFDEEERAQLSEAFALMRRIAIEEGIDVSMVEVDRAIETLRQRAKVDSAAKLAYELRFPSLAQYRGLVAEAMRIGVWLRLQTLALDVSDARVMHYLTSDREKITLRVAVLDEKQIEESLKSASTVTQEEFDAWFAAKSDPEKMQMKAFDLPRAELRFGALLLAPGQFDPAQWQDSHLKDFAVADDELQKHYMTERETRFKKEGGEGYREFEDPVVKEELLRLLQAERVMNQILAGVRQKLIDTLQPFDAELMRTQQEVAAAETGIGEASAKVATHELALAKKEQELAQQPEDPELKAAVDNERALLQAARDEAQAQKEKLPPLRAAVEQAEQARKDARASFDFPAAFAALTADKSGFVQKAMTGTRTAEELKDLDALGLDLGTWPLSAQGAALANNGDLCNVVARTSKAVAIYQATAAEPRPLKPREQLQPLVEGAYWTEKAKAVALDKRKAMDEALLRLAKEKIADKVAELEAKQESRTAEKFAEWEQKTTAAVAAAEATLAGLQPGTQARMSWEQELNRQRAELARRDDVRARIADEVKREIDGEIAVAAKEHYAAVLDAAAAEAGFTVVEYGPFSRELQREPRFDKNYDPTVVYLMRTQSQLKEGEATAVLQDFANRRWYVAVCTKVEPLQPTDVTRRDFESLRTGDGFQAFTQQQASLALRQAFTVKALEARYDVQRPVGEQRQRS